MSEQKPWRQQIMAKAMQDDAFRQELLANPTAVLERELGITLPQGVSVQVHEETPSSVHLVLPMKPTVGVPEELPHAQLMQGVDDEGIRRPPM